MSFVENIFSDVKRGAEQGASSVKQGWDDIRGKTAADETARAASEAGALEMEGLNQNVAFQQEALDYLKEAEAIPRQYREASQGMLAGLLGVPGGTGPSKAEYVQGLVDDPFYQQQVADAEKSVLKNASATGGARGGSTQQALTNISPNLLQNMYNQNMQGIGALAMGPSGAGQIAQQTSNIGQTLGQGYNQQAQTLASGITGAAGAKQAGYGNILNAGMSGLGLAFSDPKLKTDIVKIGSYAGFSIYSWIWNELASSLGLEGSGVGVMADEVKAKRPELIRERNGFMMVDYEGLERG